MARFSRTRPSYDLVNRVNLDDPQRITPMQIVDLGCGSGASTKVCAERWPEASIAGLDKSPEMIAAARAAYSYGNWILGNIEEWASQPSKPGEQMDLIFSSAALQWVDDHATLFPRLMGKLAPGGILAVQMPSYDAIPNQTMREMAASQRWRRWFPEGCAKEWRSDPLEFYHAALRGIAKRRDFWVTDYFQIMSDINAIVGWYKGTGLLPYLDPIRIPEERQQFIDEFRSRLNAFYPKLETGGVAFSLRRIFIVAGV